MKESIVSDIVRKIEGYGKTPDYQIRGIAVKENGDIFIKIRQNGQEKPESGEGAENESN